VARLVLQLGLRDLYHKDFVSSISFWPVQEFFANCILKSNACTSQHHGVHQRHYDIRGLVSAQFY